MSILERLILDVKKINKPLLLNQLLGMVEMLSKADMEDHSDDKQKIFKLAGSLSKRDAQEMKNIINEEFANIEGEW